MKRPSLAILISGRGTNLEALLASHREGKLLASPVLVISNRSEARGLNIAEKYGVPARFISWERGTGEEDCLKFLEDKGVDFLVLAGFMKILSPWFLQSFQGPIINIHPSLLPAFPGSQAQAQAVNYGVRYSGCTTHFVTEKVDGGPIILQRVVPLCPGDTPARLAERILPYEHEILVKTVNLQALGALKIKGRKVEIDGEVYRQIEEGKFDFDEEEI